MELTRSTIVLLAIALVLGAAALLLGRSPQTSDDGPQPLFSFEEDDVEAITIDTSEQALSFERGEDGAWQMLVPQTGPASEASVVYLLNLLVTEQSNRRLSITGPETIDFGLDAPLAEINVTLRDDQTHQLILGDYNFSNQLIYALVDPPDTTQGAAEDANDSAEPELMAHLVSTNFDTAVSRPLEDWLDAADAAPSSPESPEPEASPAAP
ncbi:MAG: hypothetical protein ACFB4J_04735 [Elainellaceae cyanobacterium]